MAIYAYNRSATMLILFIKVCISTSILLHGQGAVNSSLTLLEEKMAVMQARLESLESRCRKICFSFCNFALCDK